MEKARTWVVLGAIVLTIGIIQAWWFSPSAPPAPMVAKTTPKGERKFLWPDLTVAGFLSLPAPNRAGVVSDWVFTYLDMEPIEAEEEAEESKQISEFLSLTTAVEQCMAGAARREAAILAHKAVDAAGMCLASMQALQKK